MEKIQQLIDSVLFETLWPNFHPYPFAWYDSETVYFRGETFQKEERFRGNTNLFYEGEWIAIWDVEMSPLEEDDVFASYLIHEMFHCFQQEQGESRHPDEFSLLAAQPSNDYLERKLTANRLLAQLIQIESKERQLLIEQFVYARQMQKQENPLLFSQEMAVETIEGAAEYVGMKALKQLNAQLYKERMKEYADLLAEEGELLLQFRRSGYYSGTLFLLSFGGELSELSESETIYELLTASINSHRVEKLSSKKIEAVLHQRKQDIHSRILSFLETKPTEHLLSATITGFDPMNMWAEGDTFFCSHFIVLRSTNESEGMFLEGPLLLEMVEGDPRKVRAYWK